MSFPEMSSVITGGNSDAEKKIVKDAAMEGSKADGLPNLISSPRFLNILPFTIERILSVFQDTPV